MNLLEVDELKKKYDKELVVKGISFQVKKGEILGLLGPNGAGKSTTINILSTALRPTEGQIKFQGKSILKDNKDFKKSLGLVPQSLAIFEAIPAIENIKYFGSLYGLKGDNLIKKSEKALEMVGLLDRKDDLPKTFSGGMKRRLNIACALAHEPKLLILDEPTVGIDPQSRNHILESIKTLRENGTTIIYTTHYMEEVEAICDRVLIVDKGSIIACGTLDELKSSLDENIIYNIYGEGLNEFDKNILTIIDGINKVDLLDYLIISSDKNKNNLDKIILNLIENKVKITKILNEEPSLESIFLNLTGRTLRD
ncbi:MAG: ABC transporter ATP-binding protein [Clostridium sp.]